MVNLARLPAALLDEAPVVRLRFMNPQDRPGSRQREPHGPELSHNSSAMSAQSKSRSTGAGPQANALRAAERPPTPSEPAGESDAELVQALRRGDQRACAALVRRYHPKVQRLVAGALGVDGDLMDVVQDVFVSVLKNIHQLKDPGALPGWIASLAVFTARGHIRRRRRWRWIRFLAPEEVPELPLAAHDAEGTATLRAVYQVIDTLPTDERLAFSLRFVAELDLTEVAASCQVSLATIKRRLARAEARFLAAADKSSLLRARLERGDRFPHSSNEGQS
jgi:RNA polymerase sigma-70 factor (ECF subfamily)